MIYSEQIRSHIQQRKWEYCALVLWSVISLAMLFYHEPWRDEVRAWILTRELTLFQVVNAMQYDAHPILWYVWLKIFVGFPLSIGLPLASWLLCFPAAMLWLFKAPFRTWFRLLFLFTAPMLYWYPVVSRNYALMLPLLFAIAVLYPKRAEHPIWYGLLVALLANTHIVAEGIVLALFVFDLIALYQASSSPLRRRRMLVAPAITLLGVLVAFLTTFRSLTNSDWTKNNIAKHIWINAQCLEFARHYVGFRVFFMGRLLPALLLALFALGYLFFLSRKPSFRRRAEILTVVFSSVVLFVVIGLAISHYSSWWLLPVFPFAILLCVFPGCNWRHVTGIILSMGWLLLLVFGYVPFLPQRVYLLPLYAVFFAWITHKQGHSENLSSFMLHCSPLLFLMLVCSTSDVYNDWKYRFSDLGHCAQYIQEHIAPSQQLAIVYLDASSPHLFAYTRRPIRLYQYGIELSYDPGNLMSTFDSQPLSETLPVILQNHEILIFEKSAEIKMSDFFIQQYGYTQIYESPDTVLTDDDFIILLPP
ncbi:MAG: hypothetical protein J5654_07330 [Victivallales bacterium]|nr:hypothetical protein [Victivallales bacterium]